MKWFVLLLFAATAVITWQLAHRQSDANLSYSPEAAPVPLSERKAAAAGYPLDATPYTRGQKRLVYPYSIIPGGIKTLADLKLAIANDPIVARQFQGFEFQRARLVQVAQKESMFVSYRIGQKVYWTRKKLPLHPGETLVTDGNITARTRCGNRVAKVPLDTGSPLEPPEEAFNQPYAVMTAAPDPDPARADPGPPLPTSVPPQSNGWWVVPLVPAPFVALPGPDHSPSPPVVGPGPSPGPPVVGPGPSPGPPVAVAPEPGMTLLLASGLAGVYWRVRKYRRRG